MSQVPGQTHHSDAWYGDNHPFNPFSGLKGRQSGMAIPNGSPIEWVNWCPDNMSMSMAPATIKYRAYRLAADNLCRCTCHARNLNHTGWPSQYCQHICTHLCIQICIYIYIYIPFLYKKNIGHKHTDKHWMTARWRFQTMYFETNQHVMYINHMHILFDIRSINSNVLCYLKQTCNRMQNCQLCSERRHFRF